jgi:hypothetical protein
MGLILSGATFSVLLFQINFQGRLVFFWAQKNENNFSPFLAKLERTGKNRKKPENPGKNPEKPENPRKNRNYVQICPYQ